MIPAIFIEQDETLLRPVPSRVDPLHMTFAAGASAAVRRLDRIGYPLIVVSSQPGAALGWCDESDLQRSASRLHDMFAEAGAQLAGYCYCPHHPDGIVPRLAMRCACRKPAPGLLLNAAARHDIDLARSWFIGGMLDDIEAGSRAGCQTVLINNGNETAWQRGPYRQPHHVVEDFEQAAWLIFELSLDQCPLDKRGNATSR